MLSDDEESARLLFFGESSSSEVSELLLPLCFLGLELCVLLVLHLQGTHDKDIAARHNAHSLSIVLMTLHASACTPSRSGRDKGRLPLAAVRTKRRGGIGQYKTLVRQAVWQVGPARLFVLGLLVLVLVLLVLLALVLVVVVVGGGRRAAERRPRPAPPPLRPSVRRGCAPPEDAIPHVGHHSAASCLLHTMSACQVYMCCFPCITSLY